MGPRLSCVLSLWLNVLLLDVNWGLLMRAEEARDTAAEDGHSCDNSRVTHQALSHVMRVCTEPSQSSCSTERTLTDTLMHSQRYTETTHKSTHQCFRGLVELLTSY